MATTRKVLGQVGSPTAATITDLYTVPASTDTVVSVLYATNTGAATTIRVTVAPAGAADAAAHRIYDLIPIAANETIPLLQGATLAATDKVRCYNTLATVNFTLFGQENT